MRKLRALWMRLVGMFGATEEEFAAELDGHLAMHIEDGMRAGLSAGEARRQAMIRLGGLEQAKIAREAYRDFGKGSRHPAQLNFGDCFAYALARAMSEPILFKGRDFGYTDLTSALE